MLCVQVNLLIIVINIYCYDSK